MWDFQQVPLKKHFQKKKKKFKRSPANWESAFAILKPSEMRKTKTTNLTSKTKKWVATYREKGKCYEKKPHLR